MHTTIHYFGMLAERAGLACERISAARGGTLADLRAHVLQRHPALAGHTFRMALNRKLADDHSPWHPGDEVALLPPFAGG